jgi:formylglycine-generating enzyme required for sulfatase activity
VSGAPAAKERWPELAELLGRRGWAAAEINDWLWLVRTLAASLPQPPPDAGAAPGPPAAGGQGDASTASTANSAAAPARPPQAGPSALPPAPVTPPPPTPAPAEALLEPLTADSPRPADTLRLGIADSPLIPRPRQCGRALAPLNRWHEEGPALVLDVAATVEAIASARSEGLAWQPCLRPRRQPWLELQLVFDGSPSMALWQRLRRELPRLLAAEVRWRDLRCWQLLSGPEGTVRLADRRGRPCGPRRLRQRTERSLVLVVSDAVDPVWYQGAMAELLQGWAAVQPVALLQLFPQRLWLRTALAQQPAGWIRSATPMRPHGLLAWQPVEGGPPLAARPGPAPWLTLPVLQLQPAFLGPWARLLVGSRQGSALAYRFALPQRSTLSGTSGAATGPAPGRDRPPSERAVTEAAAAADREERLAVFLFTASKGARKLLALLSFAPVISLPIVRLVHGRMLAASGQDAVAEQAEVLFSGLFVPAPSATLTPIPIDQQRLIFVSEELRPRLREGLRRWEAQAVVDRVQEFVAQRLKLSQEQFVALLLAPEQCEAPADQELLRAFATVAPSCLRGLGGRYEALAEQLEQLEQRRRRPPSPEAIEAGWLQGLEIEAVTVKTAQVLRVPPLELLEINTAQWQELALRQVEFQALAPAGLADFLRQVKRKGGAVARASLPTATAWAFHEPLQRDGLSFGATVERPDPLTLTLLEIPAGRFFMGSAPAEPERIGTESPQHEVELGSFFISQTPITQAQWWQVAGWLERPGERWGRELRPNPSRFQRRDVKGEISTDDRPVERVSWHDAMEFCRRLSQRTGRTYTLPSEAQWEYACRAGTSTPFHFGETMTTELANYDGNYTYANGPKGEYRQQTTPVGMFPANAWGLQDMHGNVWEWCLDHWHGTYEGAPVDGSAWLDDEGLNAAKDSKKERLLRGGSWVSIPRNCRSAYRNLNRPVDALDNVGFRVVCLPQGPSLNP